MKRLFCTLLMGLLMAYQGLQAQPISSPYSNYGIGDMLGREMAHSTSMGGVGIGAPSVWNINSLNPALLVANDLTVFEMGIQGESRTIENNTASQKINSAGYRYIDFAFPIKPGKWTSNFSLRPKSIVNYQFSSNLPVTNGNAISTSENSGSGGLTEVNFANGFRVFKSLYLGVRATYLFGVTDHKIRSFLDGSFTEQYPSVTNSLTTYRGFNFGFGAAYGQKIGGKKSNQSIGIGLIYELGKELDGERRRIFTSETLAGSGVNRDTTSTQSSTFDLPAKIGIGFSWMKANQLTIAVDITRTDWSERPEFGASTRKYRSTYKVGTGIEYIPDFDNVDKYFARVRYRIGMSYEQLPYVENGEHLSDFGINFGWSLPVRRASFLNMAFSTGSRGTKSSNLIEERYFKFMIGATINDRWFVRRRYN